MKRIFGFLLAIFLLLFISLKLSAGSPSGFPAQYPYPSDGAPRTFAIRR